MNRSKAVVAAIVTLALVSVTRAQDNPQATAGSWRQTIVAQHGMVAAGHPLAAEAGMRILKAGGNAIDAYKSRGGIPDEGPLSISVPGAVGGSVYAMKTYGTKPLADVLAPAIEIAEGGFPVTESLANGL